MTLFLELFLMLALYYMYSIQTQMIRLVENQMNHLHELNLFLVDAKEVDEEGEGGDECDSESECGCDSECDSNCECGDQDDQDEQDEDYVKEEDKVTENDKEEEDTCATCKRSDEKCRCPNPYKLLSKKSQ